MKITKQRLKEIIREELAEKAEPGVTMAAQYVQQHPEEAAKMLEDILQGITLIKQQASDLSARFSELKPGARDRAAHGLQEVKTLLESIKI